jgi:isoamylase
VRDFWRGATGVDDLAYRLSGSSDLYDHSLRRPWQSINFVDAHDGFTLRDLVSYDEKHNEANGENNRDGTNDNRSWNHGVEGETDDPAINELRARQGRNLFATLMLSTGTPMFVAGDERWRTQGGNNNAYCLDDPTSWVDWTASDASDDMLAFARRVIFLRATSPALRQPEFFDGRTTPTGRPDLIWLRPDGEEFDEAAWANEDCRTLGMWIDGSNSQSRTREGELLTDHSWLLLMHAGAEPIDVTLPGAEFGVSFRATLDTTTPDGAPVSEERLPAGATLTLQARSLLLLKAPREQGEQ